MRKYSRAQNSLDLIEKAIKERSAKTNFRRYTAPRGERRLDFSESIIDKEHSYEFALLTSQATCE